ncbi:MAG: AAA family ATPase [Phycisphaerales bacterium]|nr:AAA family ATPase [Phycisphaerales bacterium]
MLTSIQIRNFKKLHDVTLELGDTVVLIGPNNSGKTTALQALALWDIGVRRWNERRKGGKSPTKRPGVTINRRDLITIPVPNANLLWRDLHVRSVEQVSKGGKNAPKTQNIRIDITVCGITNDRLWKCGLEFDYANDESLYCRPLRLDPEGNNRHEVPDEAGGVDVAYLPPMSGLSATEPKWEPGRISVLLGEGQTAQVLRNLCYQIFENNDGKWQTLADHIMRLFGVELLPARHISERGEITMEYRENGTLLDLSCSGRGLQQTLLLLAHLYANPGTVLLLDEPDAHLEILRQRQTYELLTTVAREQGSQIVAASHSEVILNEAADRDIVIAFVGRPHRIDDRGSQVLKSLKQIGWDQYYQAEQTGWVLYLEGPTDLAILRAFAASLGHEAQAALDRPFVHYVGNQPGEVRTHYFGLREAIADLRGIAIFDRLERDLPPDLGAGGFMWRRREIENYLCAPEVLEAYAKHDSADNLFEHSESERRIRIMRALITDRVPPIALRDRDNAWWHTTKATDDFLDPLFRDFFEKLSFPNLLQKRDYHELARLVPGESIADEVTEKLDAIARAAKG